MHDCLLCPLHRQLDGPELPPAALQGPKSDVGTTRQGGSQLSLGCVPLFWAVRCAVVEIDAVCGLRTTVCQMIRKCKRTARQRDRAHLPTFPRLSLLVHICAFFSAVRVFFIFQYTNMVERDNVQFPFLCTSPPSHFNKLFISLWQQLLFILLCFTVFCCC